MARYGFADTELAQRTLAAIGVVDETVVLEAFGRCAAPDLALRQLARVAERDDQVLVALRGEPAVRDRLLAVLAASVTLGDQLVANADQWPVLREAGSAPPLLARHADARTVAALRDAYRAALLRIVADDLTGLRTVEQTMVALSDLADATLAAAARIAAAGGPVSLAVVAMGKCGGRELNYVSDVDVIFVCDNDSDLPAATAVAAKLMEICGQVAWPVDAALRPEGSQGPLVRTLAAQLAYYQKWAKTWEFQALLKARPAAGDLALGQRWLAALQPLIWQAAERPEAVTEIRSMRRRIISAIKPDEVDRELKRGPGGLRDIEFAVQLLQLVHGRGDTELRSPSTLTALRALTAGGYVGRADGEALDRSYRFLRVVEHRLQLQRLRREHTVPDDAPRLAWLAKTLGYRGAGDRDAVAEFRAEWVRHAAEVRRLHAKLFYRPLLESVARVPADDLRLAPAQARERLEILGFADPAGALRHIESLTGGVSRTAAIQRTLLPVLLAEFGDEPEPDRGLLAYRQVSEALGHTPWYLRLLRDEGPVALRLAEVLGRSRYATDLLIRDPEALPLLADDASLEPRTAQVLREGFVAAAARHDDPMVAIAAVRALRRRELFRLACADIVGQFDVDRTGPALADVADASLAAALEVSNPQGMSFAIIGMGRLGGREMSYPSDADVLFVYEPGPGQAEDAASGEALAVAEELRTRLAAPAPDPPLGVDADLRPEGRQGPLVRSLAAYRQYYARWSKVWEAQALLRARFVAGDADLGGRFLGLADQVRYPAGGLDRAQVTEVRRIKARVDSERLPRGADPHTHAKLGRGGLADVEWTVQLLQLQHGERVPGLRTTATRTALMAARDSGLIDNADAGTLAQAWLSASAVRNALTLVRGRAADQLPRHGVELAGVVRLLGSEDPGEFVDDYLRRARRARQVVERIFGG